MPLVLIVALAKILRRARRAVRLPRRDGRILSRQWAAERLAWPVARGAQTALPDLGRCRYAFEATFAAAIRDIPSTPTRRWKRCIGPAARRGIRGHAIEISDPAEENFPYSGRTEFRDPETGQKLVAGRAETVAADYRRAWLARREVLAQGVRRMGWSFLSHSTDRPASAALAAAHGNMSGVPAAVRTVAA